MTETKMAAIQRALKEDPKMMEDVKAAKSVKDFLAICKTHGIELTQAELMKSQAERVLKLSDAELESAHINAAFYSTDTIAGCVTWALTCTCSATPC